MSNTRPSIWVLDQLREYDTFLDSLKIIADIGCGTGEDAVWWATLATRDDPPVPYDYIVYAVDHDPAKLAQIPELPNLVKLEKDFHQTCVPRQVDLLWAHDVLQYSINPLETLRTWNWMMQINAMMVLTVPVHSGVEFNKYTSRSHSGCYYHFTPVNLLYMLAVNGFDCNDAYLLKRFNDPWIRVAVYKSDIAPMDPKTTSWYDLAETGLLNPSLVDSVNKHGYLRQEDILYRWLDRENYFIDYVPVFTQVPNEAGPTIVQGVTNKQIKTASRQIITAPKIKVEGKPPTKLYD